MFKPIRRYTHWLHTRWPAGQVERLPRVNDDGSTNVPGLYITGDLTGVPLLKFSADSGARAVRVMLSDKAFQKRDPREDVLDLAIIGGGVSGFSAAIEAKKHGLRFRLFEAAEPFSTIVNFPKAKPIYTYPTDMTPAGDLQFHDKSDIKEGLLEDLREQTIKRGIEPVRAHIDQVVRKGGLFELAIPDRGHIKAHRVVVAIGRSGNFRKLDVPGEDKDKVYNRLHDPKDFCDRKALVVGGGDSALETAIALAQCGATVTLSYRKAEFSRPKPENIEKLQALVHDPDAPIEDIETVEGDRVTTPSGEYLGRTPHRGRIQPMMTTSVREIRDHEVDLTDKDGNTITIDNDVVFTMLGREAPLDFFRKSGVRISGEWTTKAWVGLIGFLLFCLWMYHWKSDYSIPFGLKDTFNQYFGLNPAALWSWIAQHTGDYFNTQGTLGHTLKISASGRSFYYTLAYASIVTVFGIRRIRRRKTPYVTWQTLTLMAIQVLPLFILPEIILPWLGHNGVFGSGFGKWFADTFFPVVDYGHGREYWRAYGFILAWPLMAWNFFTEQPLWGWLILGSIQTFAMIPAMIYFWGKGAYCGWICSCGALAETLGDTHRHKMPHGPVWNRVNMVGQALLLLAVIIMAFRIVGWVTPGEDVADKTFKYLAKGDGLPLLNWAWFVDLLWAGVLGVGLYFHFSGRVWCRFACPLAALMHIYARFSRFGIVADKKKCISCNVCTSVCHQGIDVMNFANKGLPMKDPQCVRCSACVQSCPTGVLSFGQTDRAGHTLKTDPAFLIASRVQMMELTVHGKRV